MLQRIAACCSVLQCVAVCCGVLRCIPSIGDGKQPYTYSHLKIMIREVQCIVLQSLALCCSVLHCVALCCKVLQCIAVCCSVYLALAMESSHVRGSHLKIISQVVQCRVLQSVAQRCRVLQSVAECYSVSQFVAVFLLCIPGSGHEKQPYVRQSSQDHQPDWCCCRPAALLEGILYMCMAMKYSHMQSSHTKIIMLVSSCCTSRRHSVYR